jgi:predicted protein tyrosine phosphatase
MTPMPVLFARPYPQATIECGQVTADALISIVGHEEEPARIDPVLFGGRVLRLSFDDIPVREWTDRHGKAWVGPTRAHMEEALAFARLVSQEVQGRLSVAVHCKHGKSRSSAIALTLMADVLGPGGENEAVRLLLEHDLDEQIACNPGLIRLADDLLERQGAIEAALERACPRFITWREYWFRSGCIARGGTTEAARPRAGT